MIRTVFLFIALVLASQTSSAQSISCAPESVSLIGAEILIDPSDADSENIQCAVDAATELGVQKVKLRPGEYTLAEPVVTLNYQGQLEGTTRATTIVTALGSSAFYFSGGSVSLKFMAIKLENPEGSTAAIFTSNLNECTRRTIFGEVDRVDVESADDAGTTVGVVAAQRAECGDELPLLGRLTVNRSTFMNVDTGVHTQMSQGAVLNISFNEIDALGYCYVSQDGNQDASFLNNECKFGAYGISYGNSDDIEEPINLIRVTGNEFRRRGSKLPGFKMDPACVDITGNDETVLTAQVLNNHCDLGGFDFDNLGMQLQSNTGSRVSGNTFAGLADNSVTIFDSANTVVDSNEFEANNALANVVINSRSTNTIVGPDQGVVANASESSFILN